MPKRSDRLRFAERFEGNPLEGLDVTEAYEAIRWGNTPTETFELEGPEAEMVGLGRLVLLELDQGERRTWEDDEAPYLAIGLESNRLYVLPVGDDGGPADLVGPFTRTGHVLETHYTAEKGEEDAYWFHEHEPPYPELYTNAEGGMVIEPADHEGGPSFVVAEEGIIG